MPRKRNFLFFYKLINKCNFKKYLPKGIERYYGTFLLGMFSLHQLELKLNSRQRNQKRYLLRFAIKARHVEFGKAKKWKRRCDENYIQLGAHNEGLRRCLLAFANRMVVKSGWILWTSLEFPSCAWLLALV